MSSKIFDKDYDKPNNRKFSENAYSSSKQQPSDDNRNLTYNTNQNPLSGSNNQHPHSTKKTKPNNSNEMLAYLSNREYTPNDLDDYSNFQRNKDYSASDYNEKFHGFFPESSKKENIDSFFVKSIIFRCFVIN